MQIRKTSFKLKLMLYPFVVAAVAINLFLLGLIFHVTGYQAISPISALIWSVQAPGTQNY